LSGREILLIFVFWTSLATLSSLNRIVDPRGFGFRGISPTGPVALAYIESWLWAALTPFVFGLSTRFSLERSKWAYQIPLLLTIGVGVSIVVYVSLDVARIELFDVVTRRPPPTIFAPMREIGRFRFLNHLFVYLAVLVAGYAREYFLRDRDLASRAAVLQTQLADAQLDALRMQLNPHFLFNTLHAVAALVERDPAGVRRMIARLSELLRVAIDPEGEHEVPLAEELAFLRRYIEIMEVRFQGRLKVAIDVADDAMSALVPRLILQPIVENALEHGAARASGEGVVEIVARRNAGQLVIRVSDNGPGVDENVPSGVGVANTRARLAAHYGDSATFALTSRREGGAIAEVAMPFRSDRG